MIAGASVGHGAVVIVEDEVVDEVEQEVCIFKLYDHYDWFEVAMIAAIT